MPTALFTAGLIVLAVMAMATWPPRRPGTLAVSVWLWAWLVNEMPLHALCAIVVVIAPLAARGGLDAPIGWAGLVLAITAMLLAIASARAALAAGPRIDAALDVLDPPAPPARAPRLGLLDVALLWPRRPRAVIRTRAIPFHGRLRLDVYRARDNVDRNAPVFLWVHGGAWMMGHRGQQGRPLMHALAQAGWVCVSISYRLSPRATFPDHLHDVKRAIAWTREHVAEHGGDPGCIVIGGGSAGAHLASLAALTGNLVEYQRDFAEVDTRLQGCVALYGVYDFVDDDRHFPHGGFRRVLLERVVMKRRLAEARAEFVKASPRHRVHAGAPPFLVLHGTRDTLAPIAGMRAFVTALRAETRATVVSVELPGAQHAFDVFPSLRSASVVPGIERFCAAIVATIQRARGATSIGEADHCQP